MALREPDHVKLARQVVADHERSTSCAGAAARAILLVVRAVARTWAINESVLVDRSAASRVSAGGQGKHPDKRRAVSRARTAAVLLLQEQGLRTRAIRSALELRSTGSVTIALRRGLRLKEQDWSFQRQLKDARETLEESLQVPR